MKRLLFIFILVFAWATGAAAQQKLFGIQTQIPDPRAKFQGVATEHLIFIPQSSYPTLDNECDVGTLFVHTTDNLQSCVDAGNGLNQGQWLSLGDFWDYENSTNTLYPFMANVNPDFKLGIGTTNARFLLDVDGQAANFDGFLATGKGLDAGSQIATTGAGTRLFWYPRRVAFRAGSVDGAQWDDTIANPNIGDYSVAFGRNTTASGDYSVAAGRNNTASGLYSTVWGFNNDNPGDYSLMFGQNNLISDDAGPSASGGDYSLIGGLNMNLDIDNAADVANNNIFLWGHSPTALPTPIDDSDVFIIYSGRVRLNSGREPYPALSTAPTVSNLEILADSTDELPDIAFIGNDALSTTLGRVGFFKNNSCAGACPDSVAKIKAEANLNKDISIEVGAAGAVDRLRFSLDSNGNAAIRSRKGLTGTYDYFITAPKNLRTIRGYVFANGTVDAGRGDPNEFTVNHVISTGIYTIDFTDFISRPTVSVIGRHNSSNIIVNISSIAADQMTVNLSSYPGAATDSDFMFEVTGEK